MEHSNKVFGIGLSRTGTTTLHFLLEQLGFKSLHFVDDLLDVPDWNVLDDYDAFSDSPIPLYYRQCDLLYPKSKFILTTRNKKSWLSSMKWLFTDGKILWNWDKATDRYHQKFYGSQRYDKRSLEVLWDNHHREIETYFSEKPDQLLIINIDQGFDIREICNFLEVPQKKISIDKNNKRVNASFKRKIIYYLKKIPSVIARINF